MQFIRESFVIASIIGSLIVPSILTANQIILEVIQLKHRTTNEIIPLIDPFLDKQGALSSMQGKLIIRTTPENLKEIKRLLNQIDNVPRRLIITVKQNVDRATARNLIKLSGSVSTGGTKARITKPTDTRSLINENSHGNDSLTVQVLDNQNLEIDHNTQQIQVLNGGNALIHIGKSLPISARNIIHTPQGTRVIENTRFRDTTIGFIVAPSVIGDSVTLKISPQRNISNPQFPGVTNVQQINTSISGKLGEWINLGNMENNRSKQFISPNYPSNNEQITIEQRMVLIKVEEIH